MTALSTDVDGFKTALSDGTPDIFFCYDFRYLARAVNCRTGSSTAWLHCRLSTTLLVSFVDEPETSQRQLLEPVDDVVTSMERNGERPTSWRQKAPSAGIVGTSGGNL